MTRLCVLGGDKSFLLTLLLLGTSCTTDSLQAYPCPIRLKVIGEDGVPVDVEMQKNGSQYVFVLLGFEEGDGQPRPYVQDPDDLLGKIIEEQYAEVGSATGREPDENQEQKKATGTNIDNPELKGSNSPEKCFNQTPLKQRGRSFNTNSGPENSNRLTNKDGIDFSKDLDPAGTDEFYLQPEHFNSTSSTEAKAKGKNTLEPNPDQIITSDRILNDTKLDREPLSQKASRGDIMTMTTQKPSDFSQATHTIQNPRNMQSGSVRDSSLIGSKYNDTPKGQYQAFLDGLEWKKKKDREMLPENNSKGNMKTSIIQRTTYSMTLIQQPNDNQPDYTLFRDPSSDGLILKRGQPISVIANAHDSPKVIQEPNNIHSPPSFRESNFDESISPRSHIISEKQQMNPNQHQDLLSRNPWRTSMNSATTKLPDSSEVVYEKNGLPAENEPIMIQPNSDDTTLKRYKTISDSTKTNPHHDQDREQRLKNDVRPLTDSILSKERYSPEVIRHSDNLPLNHFNSHSVARPRPEDNTLKIYQTILERSPKNINKNNFADSKPSVSSESLQETNIKQRHGFSEPSLKSDGTSFTKYDQIPASIETNTSQNSYNFLKNDMESPNLETHRSSEFMENQNNMQPDVKKTQPPTNSEQNEEIKENNNNQEMTSPLPSTLRTPMGSDKSPLLNYMGVINQPNNRYPYRFRDSSLISRPDDQTLRQRQTFFEKNNMDLIQNDYTHSPDILKDEVVPTAGSGHFNLPDNPVITQGRDNTFSERMAINLNEKDRDSPSTNAWSTQLNPNFSRQYYSREVIQEPNNFSSPRKQIPDDSGRLTMDSKQKTKLPLHNTMRTDMDSEISKQPYSSGLFQESNDIPINHFSDSSSTKSQYSNLRPHPSISETIRQKLNQDLETQFPNELNKDTTPTIPDMLNSDRLIQGSNINQPDLSFKESLPDGTQLRRYNTMSESTMRNANGELPQQSFIRTDLDSIISKRYFQDAIQDKMQPDFSLAKQTPENSTLQLHQIILETTPTNPNPVRKWPLQDKDSTSFKSPISPGVIQESNEMQPGHFSEVSSIKIPQSVDSPLTKYPTISQQIQTNSNQNIPSSNGLKAVEKIELIEEMVQMNHNLNKMVSPNGLEANGVHALPTNYQDTNTESNPTRQENLNAVSSSILKSNSNNTLEQPIPLRTSVKNNFAEGTKEILLSSSNSAFTSSSTTSHPPPIMQQANRMRLWKPKPGHTKSKNKLPNPIQKTSVGQNFPPVLTKPRNIKISKSKGLQNFNPRFMKVTNSFTILINGKQVNFTFIKDSSPSAPESRTSPTVLKPATTNQVENVTCLSFRTIEERGKTLSVIHHKPLTSCPTTFPCQAQNSCSVIWTMGLVGTDFKVNRWKSQSYFVELLKGLRLIKQQEIRAAFQDCVVRHGLGKPFTESPHLKNSRDRDQRVQAQNSRSMNSTKESLKCESRVKHFKDCFVLALFMRPKKSVSNLTTTISVSKPNTGLPWNQQTQNKPTRQTSPSNAEPGTSTEPQNVPVFQNDLRLANSLEVPLQLPARPKYELIRLESRAWLRRSSSLASAQIAESINFLKINTGHPTPSEMSMEANLLSSVWSDLFASNLSIHRSSTNWFSNLPRSEDFIRRQAIGLTCSVMAKELNSKISSIQREKLRLKNQSLRTRKKHKTKSMEVFSIREKCIHEPFRTFDEEYSSNLSRRPKAGCVEWLRYQIPSRIHRLTALVLVFSLIGLLHLGFTIYLFSKS